MTGAPPPYAVVLARRAQRDLRALDPTARRRVLRALDALARGDPNLDVTALVGQTPWRRLRIGTYRVVHRRLTADELGGVPDVTGDVAGGQLVARIVDRRDLDRAIDRLPPR